jgi:hypothetical protein
VNTDAKGVILGITPGFTQMNIARKIARQGLLRGEN